MDLDILLLVLQIIGYTILSVILLFFVILAVNVIYLRFFLEPEKGVCRCTTRLDGKTVLITGGNSGIGFETARDMAKRGARVIIASRDVIKSQKAVEDIVKTTGNSNVEYRQLDLSKFSNVKEFAKEFNETEDRLDILVNNSGVAIKASITQDGLVNVMQINHFAPFLLTNLLLNKLEKCKPSRIVVVASVAHKFCNFQPDYLTGLNLRTPTVLRDWFLYANSKLCNILWVRGLAQRLPEGITANAAHPGIVKTDIFNNVPTKFLRWFYGRVLEYCFKNPAEGAQAIIHACVAPSLEKVTGVYMRDCKIVETSSKAKRQDYIDGVWEETLKNTQPFEKYDV